MFYQQLVSITFKKFKKAWVQKREITAAVTIDYVPVDYSEVEIFKHKFMSSKNPKLENFV